MALMMVFSNRLQEKIKEKALSLGFDYYQTDNIYRFITYAAETRPDIVMMHFENDFNNNADMMLALKRHLCHNDICPQIFLNKPDDFTGEEFFRAINMDDMQDVLRTLEQTKQNLQ